MRSLWFLLVAAGAAVLPAIIGRPAAAPFYADVVEQADVDVELVLAVDVSYSMDPDEQQLQREGYVTALKSRQFLEALNHGPHGRIALTYVEWAGVADQKVLMPWRIIDGEESAVAVADEIATAPYRRAYRTSISGALVFAAAQFERSGHHGIRRVIDVSGDGANNQGPPIVVIRDEVVAKGITINGLPIMLKAPVPGSIDIENLDVYYEDCVIGGPGAFVVPIRQPVQFKEATRTKLVLEIASRSPPRFIPAAAAVPRVSCTIGERLWQQRWGNGLDFN
jgi:Protein of unknown function (DUF1194)